jgi:hypothetical protein
MPLILGSCDGSELKRRAPQMECGTRPCRSAAVGVIQLSRFTGLDHARIVREAREAAMALHEKAKWPA